MGAGGGLGEPRVHTDQLGTLVHGLLDPLEGDRMV